MTFFSKKNLSGDILGGVTAGIMTLPAALAYGLTTGLGATAGIVTAIILGLLATLFGGTNTQISSPIGSMTVVVAFIVTQEVTIQNGSLEQAMPVLIMIFLLTGLFQMLLGIFKLGWNIKYVPFSVISGFMSGIGIIIIVLQVKDITGVYDSGFKSVPDIIMHIGYFLKNIHGNTLILATASLVIIYAFPLLNKRIPGSLVALIVVTAASYFLDMDVKRLGNIELVLPKFDMAFGALLQDSGTILRIVFAAFSLAILGSINTLLASVVADKLTATEHNSNKELIGQGLGNLVAGIFGGFPGGGAAAFTVANIKSGGRNRLSGLISTALLLLVMLFGKEVAALIPQAVLAGILTYVGIALIDKQTLRKMKVIPRSDNIVMLTVLVLTVCWNLLYAVLTGLVIASFYFMKRMADVVETDTEKTKIDSLVEQVVNTMEPDQNLREKICIKTIRGPVFFGFSSRFLTSMRNLSDQYEAVIFDLSMVPYMDYSGVKTFIEVIQFLNEKKVNVCFSGLSEVNLTLLQGIEIIPKMVDSNHIFDSVEECIMWLHVPGHLKNVFEDQDKLYLPPAFTPNGDGINDDWSIANIKRYPAAEIAIYDTREKLVFESKGYDKPWNGTLDGELLPVGEYRYKLQLNNGTDELMEGSVYLFR